MQSLSLKEDPGFTQIGNFVWGHKPGKTFYSLVKVNKYLVILGMIFALCRSCVCSLLNGFSIDLKNLCLLKHFSPLLQRGRERKREELALGRKYLSGSFFKAVSISNVNNHLLIGFLNLTFKRLCCNKQASKCQIG